MSHSPKIGRWKAWTITLLALHALLISCTTVAPTREFEFHFIHFAYDKPEEMSVWLEVDGNTEFAGKLTYEFSTGLSAIVPVRTSESSIDAKITLLYYPDGFSNRDLVEEEFDYEFRYEDGQYILLNCTTDEEGNRGIWVRQWTEPPGYL